MTPDHREAFEERAAILEHDAGMTREQAEREAARRFCPVCRTNQPRDGFKPVESRGKVTHWKCAGCHAKAAR